MLKKGGVQISVSKVSALYPLPPHSLFSCNQFTSPEIPEGGLCQGHEENKGLEMPAHLLLRHLNGRAKKYTLGVEKKRRQYDLGSQVLRLDFERGRNREKEEMRVLWKGRDCCAEQVGFELHPGGEETQREREDSPGEKA